MGQLKGQVMNRCSIFFIFFVATLFFDNVFSREENQSTYKLYTFTTPSHKNMFEKFFLSTIKIEPLIDVVHYNFPQKCPKGIINTQGFHQMMFHKLEIIKQAIKDHWGNRIFFYSDVDIIFFKPFVNTALESLKDNDFAVQREWPSFSPCCGFYVMRGNQKTLDLIEKAMENAKLYKTGDQNATARALKEIPKNRLKWTYLPIEKFSNGAYVMLPMRHYPRPGFWYKPKVPLELDKDIVLFHANWCLDLNYKYDFLKAVKELFNAKINTPATY